MIENIVISEQFKNYIEGLNFEKNSRSELLTFMLVSDMTNEKMFNKIQTEYLEYFIQFELAKSALEETYIIPKYNGTTLPQWTLSYETGEVTIHE